jgi:hypothetical protein
MKTVPENDENQNCIDIRALKYFIRKTNEAIKKCEVGLIIDDLKNDIKKALVILQKPESIEYVGAFIWSKEIVCKARKCYLNYLKMQRNIVIEKLGDNDLKLRKIDMEINLVKDRLKECSQTTEN